MSYTALLDTDAIQDLQDAIDYYDNQKIGLGEEFDNQFDKVIEVLELNPFFQVRYDNVHCFPMKKFPYMAHYTINKEKQIVMIRAILSTRKNIHHLAKLALGSS
jgi:hypothetical protein